MRGRLTDQAAMAVALARSFGGAGGTSVGHLLAGLATEPEGRAGRRLRERGTAAALLCERAGHSPAPPLDAALVRARDQAGERTIDTVALLDAALSVGGEDLTDLLEAVGFQRDLDAWVLGEPAETWFDAAETFGWAPGGDGLLDPVAARVVAQVRAVDGGAVEVVIAAAAAPEAALDELDPEALAAAARRLRRTERWDAGLDQVVATAGLLAEPPPASVRDLLRAALIAGGDGPRSVLEAAGAGP